MAWRVIEDLIGNMRLLPKQNENDMDIAVEIQPILWSGIVAKELSQWERFQLHGPRVFQSS